MTKNIFIVFAMIAFLSMECCTNNTECPCPCQPTPPTEPPQQNAAQFFGTCAFPWTPTDKMGIFSTVRAYLSADFISTANGIFVEPIYKARTDPAAGLDTWIKALNDKGCMPILCINQTPNWLLPGNTATAPGGNDFMGAGMAYNPQTDFKDKLAQGGRRGAARVMQSEEYTSPEHPPIQPGADRTDPASYAAYAKIFAELAKRYGSRKYAESDLWVNTAPRWTNDPPNGKKSGLNLRFGLEVWNEPDKWWRKGDGSGVYMEPEEYAALFAACYQAVKNVDPGIPVYNAGLTGFDIAYLKRFIAALKALQVPMPDAFTVHHYSHAGNVAGKWPPTWWDNGACSPESDKDFQTVSQMVALAKAEGRELWVTEFGYDTRSPSWMYAAPFAGKTSEQIQGEWLARTFLQYMRLGVARAMLFNGNDEAGAPNGGLYANSGILYGEGEPGSKAFTPKPAYYTLQGIMEKLKGSNYIADESTTAAVVLRFENNAETIWAYWTPTQDGRVTIGDIGGQTVPIDESVKFLAKPK